MATITLKNIPELTYKILKQVADKNHCSIIPLNINNKIKKKI